MQSLVKIGVFADELQQLIECEFICHGPENLAQDEGLRQSVRGLITRSNYQVPQALLESLPALQVIATCGVGFDGIPVAYARSRGITVTHTPGVLDDAVCAFAPQPWMYFRMSRCRTPCWHLFRMWCCRPMQVLPQGRRERPCCV